jgi:hypothetical protein
MRDPAFRDEANRSKLEISPLSGDDLVRLVGRMFSAPAEVRAAAKAAME